MPITHVPSVVALISSGAGLCTPASRTRPQQHPCHMTSPSVPPSNRPWRRTRLTGPPTGDCADHIHYRRPNTCRTPRPASNKGKNQR